MFANVRHKWGALRKMAILHPDPEAVAGRLMEIFSGYHSPKGMVLTALQRAGFDAQRLLDREAGLAAWPERGLHLLVAHFLRARGIGHFPGCCAAHFPVHSPAP